MRSGVDTRTKKFGFRDFMFGCHLPNLQMDYISTRLLTFYLSADLHSCVGFLTILLLLSLVNYTPVAS